MVILQEHGQRKGDDLLASVRVIGRYDYLFTVGYSTIFYVIENQQYMCAYVHHHFVLSLAWYSDVCVSYLGNKAGR